MNSIHGGHVVARALKKAGVKHIFGQDSPEWLFAVLDHDEFAVTITRDERSAGFAADAVARLTGRPAVATGIHGPGFMNLLTPLYEAREASSPVVALVSGVESEVKGVGAFQDVDQVAVVRDVVKWAVRVERSDRLESTVMRAVGVATSGRPGPVMVELPNDIMEQPCAPDVSGPSDGPADTPEYVLPTALAIVLGEAERPALILGSGSLHVGEALVTAAERLGAAVCVTAMGRGAFPETHPLFAGVVGFMTDREDGSGAVANEVLKSADLAIVVGSSLDGVTTDGGRLPADCVDMIRVDLDAEVLALDSRSRIRILACSAEFASSLDALPVGDSTKRRAQEGQIDALWSSVHDAQRRRVNSAATTIAPSHLFGKLQAAMRPDDIVVCDAAYSSIWALSYLRQGVHFERATAGRGAGTLGFGLPGAIGAAAAFPGRRIIAIVGDGGFGFGWAELETAARVGADITVVILNNSQFAYQQLWHQLKGTTPRGLDFADVRHDLLAEAVGGRGYRVSKPSEIAAALASALRPGLAVLDAVVDADELPPFRKERHLDK